MIYLKRSNVYEKKNKLKTTLIVLSLGVLFLIHVLFPNVYPTILYPIASIFWAGEHSVLGWFGNMGGMVRSKYGLIKENKNLREEIASQETAMLLLDALRTENEELKKMGGRTGTAKDVLGVVLVRPPITAYDTFVIDVGLNEGVAVGNQVYGPGEVLIGDVVEVYKNQSKVSLFSTPGRSMSVLISSSTVAAQAIGRGNGNFYVTLPADALIKEQDIVLSSQIRPHAFGVVEKIVVDSSDSLQTILFKLPINIQHVRFVQVDISTEQ